MPASFQLQVSNSCRWNPQGTFSPVFSLPAEVTLKALMTSYNKRPGPLSLGHEAIENLRIASPPTPSNLLYLNYSGSKSAQETAWDEPRWGQPPLEPMCGCGPVLNNSY